MTQATKTKVDATPEEISKIPSFVFCRWLSGSPYTIMAANIFNRYSKIPIENQFEVIHRSFGGKVKYIPYPKSTAESEMKEIEYLAQYFKISRSKAREYLDLIDKEELRKIVDAYETESKIVRN